MELDLGESVTVDGGFPRLVDSPCHPQAGPYYLLLVLVVSRIFTVVLIAAGMEELTRVIGRHIVVPLGIAVIKFSTSSLDDRLWLFQVSKVARVPVMLMVMDAKPSHRCILIQCILKHFVIRVFPP